MDNNNGKIRMRRTPRKLNILISLSVIVFITFMMFYVNTSISSIDVNLHSKSSTNFINELKGE